MVFVVIFAIVFFAILLVLFALCFRISLSIIYNDLEKKSEIRYLFLRKKIFSSKSVSVENDLTEKGSLKTESKTNGFFSKSISFAKKLKESKSENKKVKSQSIFSFDDYIAILSMINEKVIKKLFFERLYAIVAIGTSDADKTALNYGRLSSTLGSVVIALQSAGKIKKGNVRVIPDFTSPTSTISADISLSFIPVFMLPLLFSVLKIYLKNKKKLLKEG